MEPGAWERWLPQRVVHDQPVDGGIGRTFNHKIPSVVAGGGAAGH